MATAEGVSEEDSPPDRYEVRGHEVLEKEVGPTSNSAHVYLPKEWLGDTVKIVRVTKTEDGEEE